MVVRRIPNNRTAGIVHEVAGIEAASRMPSARAEIQVGHVEVSTMGPVIGGLAGLNHWAVEVQSECVDHGPVTARASEPCMR